MITMVTGCAGFIGSTVTSRLLGDGHHVVGVDEINDAYDTRLKEHRLEALRSHPQFTFHRHDVADRDSNEAVFSSVDIEQVYHLAARAGVRQSVEDPWLYTHTNVDGTLGLLEACRGHDVDRFLMASTSSLYGLHNESPFNEEADTSRPLSPYAASKKGAEALCATYTHLYGIHTIVPRYFTVYGPAGRPDMSVFRFIRHIANGEPIILYGTGEQERDFTYVDDIAEGTVRVSTRLDGHQIVNLGNDDPVSINDLIEKVSTRLGKSVTIDRRPMPKSDMMTTWADIDKARSVGWEPTVSLDEGIAKTVDWYLEHKDWVDNVGLAE